MQIDIFFDLVCPWCYIGKSRLASALAQRPHLPVTINWLPFQLNPRLSRGVLRRQSHMAARVIAAEQIRQARVAVLEAARGDGLALALKRIGRPPDTQNAHRLVGYAARLGLEADLVVDRLFRAYFEEGCDIGERAVLLDIAGQLGARTEAVADYLDGDGGLAAIRAADLQARRLGIQAIPCFVFDRRYAVSGAQDPPSFLPLFDLADTAPAEPVG